LRRAVDYRVDVAGEIENFFAVWAAFFEESLEGVLMDGERERDGCGMGRTFCVMTIEQTMQARRLRCWFGGTKFSLMVRGGG
jgi:hypothetical protein